MRLLYRIIISLILLIASNLWAETFASSEGSKESTIKLLVGRYGEEQISASIFFDQAEKWKTYWKYPGDAGIAPSFEWKGSRNVSAIEISWPTPTRKEQIKNVYEYVFENDLILPIKIFPEDPSKKVELKLKISYAVCNVVCIPLSETLALEIKPGELNEENEEFYEKASAAIPQEGSELIEVLGAKILLEGDELYLLSKVRFADRVKTIDLIIDDAELSNSLYPPELLYRGEYVLLKSKFRNFEHKQIDRLLRNDISLLYLYNENEGRHYYTKLTFDNSENFSDLKGGKNVYSLLSIMLFAFLGGLILNCMPCVLPVLSIKIVSILKQSGRESAREISADFVLTTMGIYLSFAVLAIVTISLQTIGESVGFGFQFQQPLFGLFMTLVIFLFASNLWGDFEFKVPERIPFFRLNQNERNHSSKLGHFMSGVLATLLATPCTAPFLGVAVGYALSEPPLNLFLIFFFMASGFALPFILLSIFPGIFSYFPKPGKWMIRVKKICAILLYLTAIWLIYIYYNQVGTYSTILLIISLILMKILLTTRTKKIYKKFLLLIALVANIYLSYVAQFDMARKAASSSHWHEFNPIKISQQLDEGKVVLVNITADWCLICKLNYYNVFRDKRVINLYLENKDLYPMEGDITRSNPQILEFMQQFGRSGIPFTIVYSKKFGEPLILSELLTISEFEAAMRKAGL